jgi:signal transduction histidine kinase
MILRVDLELKMRPNLSLTAKGLILVAIPLLFQVCFVFLLTHFQQDAEMEAQRAIAARNISDHISVIMADAYNLYESIYDFGHSRPGHINLSFIKVMDRVTREYAELDQLTRDKPEINVLVKKSASSVAEAKEVLDQAVRAVETGNLERVYATKDENSEHLGKLLHGVLSTSLRIVAEHEQEFANSSNRRQAELRAKVMQLAFGVLAFNIIGSVLLALFFVKTVVTRLHIMSDNAVRLASNEPLHHHLSGGDEIAELDLAFHQMADTIVESSRMKQELVGMLTHDLRTPLTFIQGCLDMMTQGRLGELNDRGRKLIKLANRNSFFMMGLINDLLDSQKIQSHMMSIESEEVCIAELFEQVRLTVADWVEEHGIKIEIEDSDLFVKGDQEKLCRVLLNLVSNAVKYSKDGDTIALGARELKGQVEVTVADQGPGIPKEMLKAVFDRFQQVSTDGQARKGSGLGLSICQDLVSLHGGKIWVTSERGMGSTFHFTLPAA